jgi:hypothetical protein
MSEFEKAVELLEKVASQGGSPSHYLARHLLLALGANLRSGPQGPTDSDCAERARRAGEAAGPSWAEAIQSEISLASGEFAQCLDPRYLGLPNYDLGYTRAARQRLEDRLIAARALGFEPRPRDLEMIALADQVLAAFEERRTAP